MYLFPKTNFDFLRLRWAFFLISGTLLGASVLSLATRGVHYGIDFTGGTVVELKFDKNVELKDLRQAFKKAGVADAAMQRYTGTNIFSIRIQANAQRSSERIDQELASVQADFPGNAMTLDSKSYVGPAVGRHLFQQAVWAIVLSLAGIIIYLGFRFSNPIWGVAGIIALFHDVLATYGLFSIMGMEVDLLIVSAMLTIGGYSIHDTIVIFDRMREKLKHMRKEPLDQVMNESMNETLSRTLITSSTVLIVVTILYFFGGPVIHHFALAMVFGTLVGTYSSIAVATPLVYEWTQRGARRQRQAQSAAPARPTSKPKPLKK